MQLLNKLAKAVVLNCKDVRMLGYFNVLIFNVRYVNGYQTYKKFCAYHDIQQLG